MIGQVELRRREQRASGEVGRAGHEIVRARPRVHAQARARPLELHQPDERGARAPAAGEAAHREVAVVREHQVPVRAVADEVVVGLGERAHVHVQDEAEVRIVVRDSENRRRRIERAVQRVRADVAPGHAHEHHVGHRVVDHDFVDHLDAADQAVRRDGRRQPRRHADAIRLLRGHGRRGPSGPVVRDATRVPDAERERIAVDDPGDRPCADRRVRVLCGRRPDDARVESLVEEERTRTVHRETDVAVRVELRGFTQA